MNSFMADILQTSALTSASSFLKVEFLIVEA
jgi:hypothetical protein